MSDSSSFMEVSAERVDPERLSLVLQDSGWTIAGLRTGVYVRLLPPGEGGRSILVPLDQEAPEYHELMQAALADIRQFVIRDISAANVPARLVVEPSDSFRFRAESAAPSGLISWSQGEKLIESARRILVAGAKTHLQHLTYFGNRFGQFATRYLDNVLMGQTVPGSYVVTAFTPASGIVQIAGSQASTAPPLFDLPSEVASTRAIGVSVMSAAQATREAVDHYKQRGSLAGFEDLVDQGVSYEMTVALSKLVSGSDGADISVEWDPSVAPPSNAPSSKIEIHPSDVDVLAKASTQLVNTEPPSRISIMGRVHLLTQQETGGPGVVGIENLSAKKPKKLRVRLNDDDYHIALRAHDRNDAVIIEGRMEREGNIHWVYDGRLVSVLGSIEDIRGELQSNLLPETIENQMELGSANDETGRDS